MDNPKHGHPPHPEFELESTRFDSLKQSLESRIAAWKDGKDTLYRDTEEHVGKVLKQSMEDLTRSLPEPYFGRLDLLDLVEEDDFDDRGETIYIGRNYIDFHDGGTVVDWRTPIGSLFYQDNAEVQEYDAPGGRQRVRLLLKRRLIADGVTQRLAQILDDLDRRPKADQGDIRDQDVQHREDVLMISENNPDAVVLAEEVVRNPDAPSPIDAYLLQMLYSRGDPKLQDIVTTIQAQQNRLIRAPHDLALVINGSAGSGKTSIAYHRLAYLLYPQNNIPIRPEKTIIFAPNTLFLDHVKTLLPALGVRGVKETTFDTWALERMGMLEDIGGAKRPRYRLIESALDIFLSPEQPVSERRRAWQRAQRKGSMRMLGLLKAYVEQRRQEIRIPAGGLRYEVDGLVVNYSGADLQACHRQALKDTNTLNGCKGHLFRQLLASFTDRYRQRIGSPVGKRFDTAKQTITRQLRRSLDYLLPDVRPRDDYYALLGNRPLVETLYKKVLQNPKQRTTDIALLTSTTLPPHDVIDREDVAAIYTLFLLANGKQRSVRIPRGDGSYDTLDTPYDYQHVVVDEAQDVSPLKFLLIAQASATGSMTILGDVAQGVFGHRGIGRWEEARRAFQRQFADITWREEKILQNYRSTQEVVRLSNAVLANLPNKRRFDPAEPFRRSGEVAVLVHCTSDEAMIQRIVADIGRFREQGSSHLAILVKRDNRAIAVGQSLKQHGLDATVFTHATTEQHYQGGLAVLPITLAKGLEFETVLVIDADDSNYRATDEYAGRLLYVAMTRALHQLRLYTVGTPTKYLIKGDAPDHYVSIGVS